MRQVCPFSHSVDKAGLPQGGVTYPITRASSVEQLYQAFWEQAVASSHSPCRLCLDPRNEIERTTNVTSIKDKV